LHLPQLAAQRFVRDEVLPWRLVLSSHRIVRSQRQYLVSMAVRKSPCVAGLRSPLVAR
jgi:hypothetical protein